jgi:hypothetical protein
VYPVDNNATAQEPINPNLLPGHAAQFLNPNLPGGYLVITNGTNALLENRSQLAALSLEQAQHLPIDWQQQLGGVEQVYPWSRNGTLQERIEPNLTYSHALRFLNATPLFPNKTEPEVPMLDLKLL